MRAFLSTALDNTSVELIIWAICIGVTIGFVYNFVAKAIAGPFVRAILLGGYIGAEKGTHLKDIMPKINSLFAFILKLSLRDGSALRNIVSVVGGALPTKSEGKKTKRDTDSALFYIDESRVEKAKTTFGEKENWYLLIVFVALAIGCAYGMTKVMPILMDALFK